MKKEWGPLFSTLMIAAIILGTVQTGWAVITVPSNQVLKKVTCPVRMPNPPLPLASSAARPKGGSVFGDPLTAQDKKLVADDFKIIANLHIPTIGPTGAPPPRLSERVDLLFLVCSAFPLKRDSLVATDLRVVEADLIKLTTPGTDANRYYNRALQVFDVIISRFREIKAVMLRYPGFGNSSQAQWVSYINNNVRYYEEMTTWAKAAYEDARRARPDDGINYVMGLPGLENFPSVCADRSVAFKDLWVRFSQ